MYKKTIIFIISVLLAAGNSNTCLASTRNDSEIGISYNAYAFGMKPGPRKMGPGIFYEYKIGILDCLSIGAHADYMYGKGENRSYNYNQGGIQLVANLHLPYESNFLSPFLSVQSGPGYGACSYSGSLSRQEFYVSLGARIGVVIKGKVSLSFMHASDFVPKPNQQRGFYANGLYSSDGIAIGLCF